MSHGPISSTTLYNTLQHSTTLYNLQLYSSSQQFYSLQPLYTTPQILLLLKMPGVRVPLGMMSERVFGVKRNILVIGDRCVRGGILVGGSFACMHAHSSLFLGSGGCHVTWRSGVCGLVCRFQA